MDVIFNCLVFFILYNTCIVKCGGKREDDATIAIVILFFASPCLVVSIREKDYYMVLEAVNL